MSEDAMRTAELDAEFAAMRTIDEALRKIPEDAQSRVIAWVSWRFHVCEVDDDD